MKSKFFWLNAWDFIKGAIVGVLTGIGTYLTTALGEPLDVQLVEKVGLAAVIAFISYLVKNLFTNSKGQILTKE